MNQVYTDLEPNSGDPNVPDYSLYDFVFHYNPYTGFWSAIHRDQYMEYWSLSMNPRIIRSRSIDTLQELITRTGGDLEKIEQLTREQ